MHKHLIDFKNLLWVEAGSGVRYKIFNSGTQQIRLVEFSEGFIEEDWCFKDHAGHVLEGTCTINFNGSVELFEVGNTFFISKGVEDKHKLIVNKGEKVLLMLFEVI